MFCNYGFILSHNFFNVTTIHLNSSYIKCIIMDNIDIIQEILHHLPFTHCLPLLQSHQKSYSLTHSNKFWHTKYVCEFFQESYDKSRNYFQLLLNTYRTITSFHRIFVKGSMCPYDPEEILEYEKKLKKSNTLVRSLKANFAYIYDGDADEEALHEIDRELKEVGLEHFYDTREVLELPPYLKTIYGILGKEIGHKEMFNCWGKHMCNFIHMEAMHEFSQYINDTVELVDMISPKDLGSIVDWMPVVFDNNSISNGYGLFFVNVYPRSPNFGKCLSYSSGDEGIVGFTNKTLIECFETVLSDPKFLAMDEDKRQKEFSFCDYFNNIDCDELY